MSACLFANSLNGDSILSHRHKDRMGDTVTEQKQSFSELNGAILSTVERQTSGERWLWKGQRWKPEVAKAKLERSSDEIQCDFTASVTLSGQQKPWHCQKKKKNREVWSKLYVMETFFWKTKTWKKSTLMCHLPPKMLWESHGGRASSARPRCSFHPLRPTDRNCVFFLFLDDFQTNWRTTRHLFYKEAKNKACLQKVLQKCTKCRSWFVLFSFSCQVLVLNKTALHFNPKK